MTFTFDTEASLITIYKELKTTKILLYVKQIYKYVWSFFVKQSW